jgi:pimeloyl-ACP methyl ester carboxylesterase
MRFGPPVSFAHRRDGRHLAYRVGGGELDLVFLFGFPTNVALPWDNPAVAGFLGKLLSFSRLILFDRLGNGLSDRGPTGHAFEDWMDDLRCVLAAAGSERAALFGCDFGGRLALLLAATYPDEMSAVVTFASRPTTLRGQDYPWGETPRSAGAPAAGRGRDAGPGRHPYLRGAAGRDRPLGGPLVGDVLPVGRQPGGGLRGAQAARPGRHPPAARVGPGAGAGAAPQRRPVRRRARRSLPGRAAAQRPAGGAAGDDSFPFYGDQDAVVALTQEFLTGAAPVIDPDRVLATVLFTDLVDSTRRAAALGDRRWHRLLEGH